VVEYDIMKIYSAQVKSFVKLSICDLLNVIAFLLKTFKCKGCMKMICFNNSLHIVVISLIVGQV